MEREAVLSFLRNRKPLLWINPERRPTDSILPGLPLQNEDILDAESRLARFAPLLAKLFPELEKRAGVIESELQALAAMASWMKRKAAGRLKGKILIKADYELPVAGSVKARGGIYEVLLFAENLALEQNRLAPGEDLLKLSQPDARDLFRRYTVSVGSTGNLGLSIGMTAAALGFKAVVHMSREAKQWKKERLRGQGVEVVEYAADYSAAVAAGRGNARSDPQSYFVDDEDSRALFLGYSVAGLRLKQQLAKAGRRVDRDHPLFVYLPCGVGGAPGGITFGLKHVFGDAVYCFFAEPVAAPCMLLGMVAGFHKQLSVSDIGLDLSTAADGLAVGRASRLVGGIVKNLVSGIFTVTDESLFRFLHKLYTTENIRIEPSAAAGFMGPFELCLSTSGQKWLAANHLTGRLGRATHIIWATGGCLVPPTEFAQMDARGAQAGLVVPR